MLVNFSIIIPTLNSSETIRNCLLRICEQDFPLYKVEVVVVDGFSSDDTVKIVKEYARKVRNPRIRIFKKKERNIAAARNVGIERSIGNTVIFLDSDCIPANRNWLQNLTDINDRDEIVVGRNIVPPDTIAQRFVRSMDQLGTPDIAKECRKEIFYNFRWGGFPATNIAIRKEVFKKIGLLDENIGSCGEDLDFALRARKSGIQVKYTTRAIVYHKHRSSITSLLRVSFCRDKNSVGFLRKYGISNRFSRTQVFRTVGTFTMLALLLFAFCMSFVLFASTALVLYLVLFGRFLSRSRDSAFGELAVYPFVYSIKAVMGSLGTVYALVALLRTRFQ